MDKRNPNGTFSDDNQYGVGKGRPQLPYDLKEARKLNRDEVERVVNKYLSWSLRELVEFCGDKENTAPVFECLIASILAKAIHQGDAQRLDFILSILRLKPKPDDVGDEKPNIHKQVVDMIQQIDQKNEVKIEPKD